MMKDNSGEKSGSGRRPSKVSLRQVAQVAGVGLGTASRALNGDFKIRVETLQKVKAAAAELGYVLPHPERRPLPAGSGHISHKVLANGRMAFFIPDRSPQGLETLLSRKLMEGVDRYLFDRKISLVPTCFNADGSLPSCIMKREVDGIILRGDLDGPNVSTAIRSEIKRFPVVSVMWAGREHPMDAVQPDNELAGRIAARILAKRGRTKLACFNLCNERSDLARAVFGFLHEAETLGIQVSSYLSKSYEDATHHGQILEKFWSASPRADGIFLTGGQEKILPIFKSRRFGSGRNRDVMGILPCAETLKLYPEFKDMYISQNAEQVGCAAAEQLLWRIQHPQSELQKILITPKLFVSDES